ncbi:MAG: hypothetical protein WCK31_04080 [bacterium]
MEHIANKTQKKNDRLAFKLTLLVLALISLPLVIGITFCYLFFLPSNTNNPGITGWIGNMMGFRTFAPDTRSSIIFPSTSTSSNPITASSVSTTTQTSVFPVVVNRGSEMKPQLCQPELFDPVTNKIRKSMMNGVPSETYTIDGYSEAGDGNMMMINGWNKEGDAKVTLASPYSVTFYQFGCASTTSYILDLSKNNVRQALYTQVVDFSFSADSKSLYLINYTNKDSLWVLHKRIINLDTNVAYEVIDPGNSCVASEKGIWQVDRLITYSKADRNFSYGTNICIWDKSANLISIASATTYWGAYSKDFLAEQIGLLPNDKNTFYAFTTNKEGTNCSLILSDITKEGVSKTADVLSKNDYPNSTNCADPEVQFDLVNVTMSSTSVKYRVNTTVSGKDPKVWSEWKTAVIK